MKKFMKTAMSAAILSGMMLFAFSCNSGNTEKFLQDKQGRKELFKQIAENHNYMMDFMEVVMQDDHGRKMIIHHEGMMETMMKEGNMKRMIDDMSRVCEEDPATCEKFTNMMMNHSSMMEMMMRKMNDKGYMDKDAMMQGMEMMNEQEGMHEEEMHDEGHMHEH